MTAAKPASSTEAAGLARILPLYDAEILSAGDAGYDDSMAQLRALRAAVADCLHSRGIRPPEVVGVERRQSQPGLVLAHALYEGATRDDELTRRVDPVHPLLYPEAFDALGA